MSVGPALTAQRPDRAPRRPLIAHGDDLTHSGVTSLRFISMHVLGAIFPVTAGIMLYGWRAVSVIVLVVGTAGIATLIWKTIGQRGSRLRLDHMLWLSLMLAMMLPAHLASGVDVVAGSRFVP